MIFQLLVAACILVSGFANTVDNCPSALKKYNDLKVFGDKCYRFLVNRERDFEDAQNYCRYYGGQLVQVKTRAINKFIVKTMKSFKNGNKKNIWIGLRYDDDEGHFIWEDGSPPDFHNFYSTDDALWNDCTYMKINTGKWFTHDCDHYYDTLDKHSFVCEYPLLVPTKEPTYPQATVDDCPKNLSQENTTLQTYGQKCYRFVVEDKDFKTFEDAQLDCEKDKGNLALVTTEKINKYLEKQLRGVHGTSRKVWIGLRFDANINNYKWVDGTPLAYFHENFHPDAFRAAEDCVAMDTDGLWFVRECDDANTLDGERPYICEYNTQSPQQNTTTSRTPSATTTSSMVPKKNTDGTTPPTNKNSTHGFANTADNCPSTLKKYKNVTIFGDKCYRFLVNREREFEEAQDYCRYYGGQLVLTKSKAVNNFVRETMKSYGDKYKSEEMWIGLRYDYTERDYLWEDGTQLNFDNFGKAQKTVWDGCAFMKVDTGKWFTHECDASHHYFVCEYPLFVPTKEPKHPQITVDDCPKNISQEMQTYGQKCYRFVTEASDFKTFDNAQQDCEKDGGNLVLVTTDKINRFLEKELGDMKEIDKVWIGLRYDESINNYKWVDGTPLAYFHENFHYGEYRAREECVSMNTDGLWFVRECESDITLHGERPYICEYKVQLPIQHTSSSIGTTVSSQTTPKTSTVTITERSTRVMTSKTPKMTTTESQTREPITCPSITCDLDCGLDGYSVDAQTGCVECKCSFK